MHLLIHLPDTDAAANAAFFLLLGLWWATTRTNLQTPEATYNTEEPHKIQQGRKQYLKTAGV